MKASLIAIAALILSTGVASAQPIMRGQGSNSLELPAQPRQQNVEPGPPIVTHPSQDVLVIPQASRDFIGEWGGHLLMENVVGGFQGARFEPPDRTIVSLRFGEQAGDVFMRTTAFASPTSKIVHIGANVVNPRKVMLEIEGFEYSPRGPVRHVEKLSLALIGKDRMDCLKYADFYMPGESAPFASVDYHGTLKIIDAAERAELEREVMEHGEVPQGTVESHRTFAR